MNKETRARSERMAWVVKTDEAPEPGYDEALREDIAVGERQLDAREGIPAEQVWKELGIE